MKSPRWMPVGWAVLAAALYALSSPLSKLLLRRVDATMMAALLYLGAGLGMGILGLVGRQTGRRTAEARLTRSELPYCVGMVVLDIAAPMGSGIYTAFPGTVTQRGQSSIYGNYIEVTHSDNLRTVYCHCDQLLAPEGANLRAGERVATVGSTGISTGPHLHFEVLVDGTFYDPAPALGFA